MSPSTSSSSSAVTCAVTTPFDAPVPGFLRPLPPHDRTPLLGSGTRRGLADRVVVRRQPRHRTARHQTDRHPADRHPAARHRPVPRRSMFRGPSWRCGRWGRVRVERATAVRPQPRMAGSSMDAIPSAAAPRSGGGPPATNGRGTHGGCRSFVFSISCWIPPHGGPPQQSVEAGKGSPGYFRPRRPGPDWEVAEPVFHDSLPGVHLGIQPSTTALRPSSTAIGSGACGRSARGRTSRRTSPGRIRRRR